MARNEGSTSAERYIKTISMRGYTVNVGGDGGAWAYRVIRDEDQQTITHDTATSETEAWEVALAHINVATEPKFFWDVANPAMLDDEYPGCHGEVLRHLERIANAARGINAIGAILLQHGVEADAMGVSPDVARPLTPSVADGLVRALASLADFQIDAAHKVAKTDAAHAASRGASHE
ncbi:hypothetical protein GALL_344270 [mine drainage metagenome]|uniref:Uncharacterized protein n=1 Tax=mine drainage metagenome TaxID=410659 RepID=A0A1J5R6I4_9ZZZZ